MANDANSCIRSATSTVLSITRQSSAKTLASLKPRSKPLMSSTATRKFISTYSSKSRDLAVLLTLRAVKTRHTQTKKMQDPTSFPKGQMNLIGFSKTLAKLLLKHRPSLRKRQEKVPKRKKLYCRKWQLRTLPATRTSSANLTTLRARTVI